MIVGDDSAGRSVWSVLAESVHVLADVVSIAIVLGAVWLWLLGRNPLVSYTLKVDRGRTIGRALKQRVRSSTLLDRGIRRVTRRYIEGVVAPSIQTEMDWLNGLFNEDGASIPVAHFGLPAKHGRRADPAASLSELSTAYAQFARRLRSRGAVGGGSSPLFEDLASAANATAEYLASTANFLAGAPDPDTQLEVVLHSGETRLAISHLRASSAPGEGVDDVATTHVATRMVIRGAPSEELAAFDKVGVRHLELEPDEAAMLEARFRGKIFDGVVPSLRGVRRERDPSSGRSRLHLILEEASFSSVMATHYVGDRGVGRTRKELDGGARLLTLSLLPVTSDGYLVLTQRSQYVSVTAGKISPAVTGNLEMRDRLGVNVDRDDFGNPDPLKALARETREELGLEIARDRLEVHGLLWFDSVQEVGTTALLASARMPQKLEDVALARFDADRVEGAWESESTLIGVRAPTDADECWQVLSWTDRHANHVPHLSAGLIAYCLPILGDAGENPASVQRRMGSWRQTPEDYGEPPIRRLGLEH